MILYALPINDSHVLGIKGWHQMNYKYQLTIARSIYDNKVVNMFNRAVHVTACNQHIQMACDIDRGSGAEFMTISNNALQKLST